MNVSALTENVVQGSYREVGTNTSTLSINVATQVSSPCTNEVQYFQKFYENKSVDDDVLYLPKYQFLREMKYSNVSSLFSTNQRYFINSCDAIVQSSPKFQRPKQQQREIHISDQFLQHRFFPSPQKVKHNKPTAPIVILQTKYHQIRDFV